MNPEVKEKWLAALRSGEYEQGVGALNLNGRFCCLGVLCDLAEIEGIVTSAPATADDDETLIEYTDVRGGDQATAFPPRGVVEWSGIGVENPVIEDRSLSDLNDEGQSFADIANLIEEHL